MTQTNWISLGTPIPQIQNLSVGRNADGRLEVFVTAETPSGVGAGSIPSFWHIWQTSPGGSWYDTWFSSGKPPAVYLEPDPAAARNADGRLEVFATGSDGALWHIWQTSPGGSWYKAWFSSGKPSASSGIFSGPVVSQNADGRLEVFTLKDGILWHIWQTAPNGRWGAWNTLNQPSYVEFTTSPIVGRNKDGRLESLSISTDGALWHIRQTFPGGHWSSWDLLGAPPNVGLTPFSTPAVSENADGRLEAFALGENELWRTWQVTPGASWG